MATYARKLKDSSGNYVAPATRASCVYMSDNTTLEDFVKSLDMKVRNLYPVGAIYQSSSNTSPASLFGGEWEEISGRFLLGSSSSHTVTSIGGEETHTLITTEIPSHYHSPALVNGIYLTFLANARETYQNSNISLPIFQYSTGNYFHMTDTFMTASTGGGQSHNNMPPYYTVNIWRRVS